MTAAVWILVLLGALGLALLCLRALGRVRGALVGAALFAMVAAGWWAVGKPLPGDHQADGQAVALLPSETCARCHTEQYESWRRTYHRTMTREATPEFVKGDFGSVQYDYQGLPTRFLREGDLYFMEAVTPPWAQLRARAAEASANLPPPRFERFRVDRLVGSHWLQECLHRDASGCYHRLPVLYHLGEHRWVHSNGAFLAPDSWDFWDKCRGANWNESCLYCHNTGPSKNPVRGVRGETLGYQSEVVELGIACEACHGPGAEHIRLNQDPARRQALHQSGEPDASIAHPERLPMPRRDDICARCHGALVPKAEMWNPVTCKDPFLPGQELTRYNFFFWSEAQQLALVKRRSAERRKPAPTDGRFWGDGTPLTTALEYNGMALSACYQDGHGKLSCLSCHTGHPDEPNFLLKPGMQTNEACFQCHGEYRSRVAEHTHHAADSPGSLCVSCHMPRQVYSLMTTHRSHRIQVPEVADSLDTGKPHACNLCHLDKSLGWTRDQLARWPGKRKDHRSLTADEEALASSVLVLTRGDARSRAIMAGAFSDPAAQKASGTDWYGSFLTRLMEQERYPVVRYLAHRGLRSVHGEEAAGPYDFLALPNVGAAQLAVLRARYDALPLGRPVPGLPLTRERLPDEAVLRRLFKDRYDPDLTINE